MVDYLFWTEERLLMKKTVFWILGIIGILIVACVLVSAGFFAGRSSRLTGLYPFNRLSTAITSPYDQPNFNTQPQGPFGFLFRSRSNNWFGMFPRFFGRMGPGMRGGYYGYESNNQPITIDQAKQAVQSYIDHLPYQDLEIKEIMIFVNQAYAEVIEKSTGIGAMELLVDPGSLNVYPEYGPNMMWNQKYGHMDGTGMMGGMMGGWSGRWGTNPESDVSAEMPVTPQRAIEAAQKYLDAHQSGTTVLDEAQPFYGYYTLDTLRDGEATGMLSVNGYTGQVFPHTWHGKFIEMWEAED
jgi:hypothetical protein